MISGAERPSPITIWFMKTSLFSVSYAGLWGQARLDLPAFIERAKALGYEGVMLMGKRPHASILDLDESRRRELRDHLRQVGLQVACLAGYTNFTAGLECAEVPLIELQVRYVEELAKLSSSLGCNLVRVFTGYESSGHSPTVLWNRCVEALRWCADVAQSYGVNLGIQNHHDLGADTDALLEMLGDIARPNVKLMFDAWSPALRGEDLYHAAKKAAPHTVATTCADYVCLRRHAYVAEAVNYRPLEPDLVRAVPMGEGFIDYGAFFRGLREGGFNGWVNYEMCSPLRGGGQEENLDACARGFLDYFRKSAQ
jgi:sugar phosphate isomerase/epimerase